MTVERRCPTPIGLAMFARIVNNGNFWRLNRLAEFVLQLRHFFQKQRINFLLFKIYIKIWAERLRAFYKIVFDLFIIPADSSAVFRVLFKFFGQIKSERLKSAVM